jgi:ferredoxin-nitrite reductase
LQSTTAICPSLFNATHAEDGILSRIRLPAGLVTSRQCDLLANVVNQFGNGEIQITNRANFQIRTTAPLTTEILLDFQDYGLASQTESNDGLRNIMVSPIAGIDVHAKINLIPLVKEWNFYLSQHPELAILSHKFSVCFDGGENIRISDRPNDICLVAIEIDHQIYFSLHLGIGDRGESPVPVGLAIAPPQVIAVLAALTEVYREYTDQKINQINRRSPRLRDLIHDWGLGRYLQLTEEKLGYSLTPAPLSSIPREQTGSRNHEYLGVHPQKQLGLFYMGVVIPLGRLTAHQLQGLSILAKKYGGGALRLTPWQNLLITDIAKPNIAEVTQAIFGLGLHISAKHPYAAIAACSGYKGCKAAFTDTQGDAQKVATHLEKCILEKCIQLDQPINIHFSGCDKSCAQHHPSDIAVVGIAGEDKNNPEIYSVYVGDRDTNFGRKLYAEYPAKNLPILIEQLLTDYQNQRLYPQQTFKEFINQ